MAFLNRISTKQNQIMKSIKENSPLKYRRLRPMKRGPGALHYKHNESKEMLDLEEEKQKSKLTHDNVVSFNNAEQLFKKKIDEIKDELQNCMASINGETKKNIVLTELIAVLKGEMSRVESLQKQEQEVEFSVKEKLGRKIEYDIKQILQKHNEEIAKINSLKEQADSSRSERVVFSNLFKTLEKQIKDSDLVYKQQLLHTTAMQYARDLSFKPQHPPIVEEQEIRQASLEEAKVVAHGPLKKAKIAQSFHTRSTNSHTSTIGGRERRLSLKPEETNQYSREIKMMEDTMERIMVLGECGSIQETIEHYCEISNQNANLALSIARENQQIEEIQAEIDLLSKQQKEGTEEAIEDPTEGGPPRLEQDLLLVPETNPEMGMFEQIAALLKIDLKQAGNIREAMLTMAEKISLLGGAVEYKRPSREKAQVEVQQLDLLMEKMEKFSECERVLDKKAFKLEYIKEINKFRKPSRYHRKY